MNNIDTTPSWKLFARQLLSLMRLIFLLTITWDFFLTVVLSTSTRSIVLLSAGPTISPIIVGAWILAIVGLSLIYISTVDLTGIESLQYSKTAYVLSIFIIFVYVSLCISSCITVGASWPLKMNLAVNAAWAVAIVYFRTKISALEQSE